MKAEIVTTYKLSKNEVDDIINRFKFLKDYEVENTIDLSIKAGFLIKYEGKILDFTVSTQLKNFKKSLYEID